MNRELYLTLLLFAATLLGIWAFIQVLSPFLVSIAWALCLAAITFPAYRLLRAKWRAPRTAALLMVIFTALVILLPLTAVLFMAGEETIRLAESGIPRGMEELEKAAPSFYAWLNRQLGELGVEGGVDNLADQLKTSAPGLLWRPVMRGTWEVLGGAFTLIMGLVIMFATQYFVYTEAPRLSEWARGLLPLSDTDVDRIFFTLRTATSSAVLGSVVVALVQGVLAGLGYAFAGIEAPILWGVVTAFFSLLPVGGSALIWGPIVIYLFTIGDYGKAWFLLAWGAVFIGGIDNVLRPWLLRRTGSRVHPMLLFFAILSGIGLFGMSGIVFGPLLIAVLFTLAQIYRDYMARMKEKDEADSLATGAPAVASEETPAAKKPAPPKTPAAKKKAAAAKPAAKPTTKPAAKPTTKSVAKKKTSRKRSRKRK